jgi:hypothetical protein
MKTLLLLILFSLNVPALEDRQLLMDSIVHDAIRIGHGPNTYYAFVDPLCLKSQRFIEMIDKRKDLQNRNSYYIFLYRLPKFDSDQQIYYIYQSQHPIIALKEIMIDQDYDQAEMIEVQEETRTKVTHIAEVAQQLKMKRRPYLLIFDEGSKYCHVSEGTAPCLEENSFDE